MEEIYGFPSPMPFGIDFVTYSNEDVGFTSAFAAGSDNYSFAMPYPSSLDLWEESMIVFCIEFLRIGNGPNVNTTALGGLTVYLSMLDDEFGANWGGSLVDAEDEAFKSQFAGPMYVGMNTASITATASVEGNERNMDPNVQCKYFPPEPLDLVTPLYIQLVNSKVNITLATNGVALDDDADSTERFAMRVWFLKRKYTSEEKRFLQRLPTRFQQLDS